MKPALELIPIYKIPEETKRVCECGKEFMALIQTYCDECFDILRKKRDEEERQILIENRIKSFWRNVKPEFKNTGLKLLPYPFAAKDALKHDWNTGKGLLMHGESGVAKTRVAILCLEKAIKQGKTVEIVDEFRLHAIALKPYDNEDWMKRACNVGVCLIDDLGNQPLTEAVEFALWQILKTRKDNCLENIITTQYIGESLANRFRSIERADAILRRLEESCVVINFNK